MTVPKDSPLKALLGAYRWYDHAEGMKFADLERNAFRTVGHWLFLPGTFSAFHQVTNCDEVWAIHAGRLLLHVLELSGAHRVLHLGMDAAGGERAVASVPAGCWQAAELPPGEAFAFGSNICAPGFHYSELRIPRRDELVRLFPARADLIHRLTHGVS